MSKFYNSIICVFAAALFISSSGCSSYRDDHKPDTVRPRVVATTSIIGDIVGRVGGDAIDVNVLIPRGLDAHDYQYSPRDFAMIEKADVVFFNGGGLESNIDHLVSLAAGRVCVLADAEDLFSGEGVACKDGHMDHASSDPHYWTDPRNVMVWAGLIAEELGAMNPSMKEDYIRNAAVFIRDLESLDHWIRERISLIPPKNRILVTDHHVFEYFIRSYGFQDGDAIIRGNSTLAQPSAREFSELMKFITEHRIPAVFVGEGENHEMADRLKEDLGVRVLRVYTGSLSAPGGPASDYKAYMRFNVNAFVDGLTPDESR